MSTFRLSWYHETWVPNYFSGEPGVRPCSAICWWEPTLSLLSRLLPPSAVPVQELSCQSHSESRWQLRILVTAEIDVYFLSHLKITSWRAHGTNTECTGWSLKNEIFSDVSARAMGGRTTKLVVPSESSNIKRCSRCIMKIFMSRISDFRSIIVLVALGSLAVWTQTALSYAIDLPVILSRKNFFLKPMLHRATRIPVSEMQSAP